MRPLFKTACLAIAMACAIAGPTSANASTATHYKLVKTIDLPGKGGHGDWVVFDPATREIWLAQSPDHDVVVLDADTLGVKATIAGIEDGNGIALNDKFAFVADAANNKLVVIDKRTDKQVAAVDTAGKGPDGVALDTRNGRVYVANDDSDTETVFMDQPPFTKVAQIALTPQPAKHGPDVNLYEQALGRIYQPVDNVIDVIDPDTQKVVDVWNFHLKKDAKPMVYDSQGKHLIIGSRDEKVLIVDADGKLVATVPFEGGNIDQTAIDVAARRIFLGDKSGDVDVIDLDTRQVVDHLHTEKNVHTLAVDPRTHRIFVYLNESNKVDVFEPV
ncbi:YncE family protein [Trinickia acidisoli]|uniref:YncE family protein n=1 Tax=Trinickia acidisoli TaxID=2767482 RepID=UPI001A8FDAD7|nr:YncE family protein [Trinickia acidisoli]